jgi:hypothetical protein
MYFHTSLSVLISFISFSCLSLFCFFFSLHLPLYLLFASRNLLLSILFLLHPLNAFTASFSACSHSLSHHPFFLPAPFDPLTVTSFFVVPFPITLYSFAAIFSTSCSSNVAFSSLVLYSSTTYCSCLRSTYVNSPSSSPCLFQFSTSHPFSSIHSISLFLSAFSTLSFVFLLSSPFSSSQFLAPHSPILPLKSPPTSMHSSIIFFIVFSTRLVVVHISLLYLYCY